MLNDSKASKSSDSKSIEEKEAKKEKKKEIDKEFERQIMVKQEIRQVHGNKLMRNKKVIELATGRLLEESDEEAIPEGIDGVQADLPYEMKMDKDTWQFFRSQHQSIKN